MAGVIQEIDLIIGKASVAVAEADAAKAGAAIGRAIGEAPAVKQAARALGQAIATELAPDRAHALALRYIERLQRQFDLSAADTRERLARGLINPQQARQLGEDAARQFNAGLLSQIKTLGVGGSLSGPAGQQVYLQLAGGLKNVAVEGTKATAVVSGVRSAMFALASTAAGVPGPVGRIVSLLLTLGGGGGIAIGVAAAIGVIALAWEKFTRAGREAAKATQEFIDKQVDAAKARAAREDPEGTAREEAARNTAEAERISRDLDAARRGRETVERGTGQIKFTVDTKEVERLEKELAKVGVSAIETGRHLREALSAKPSSEAEQALDAEVQRLGSLLTLGRANLTDRQRAVDLQVQFRQELLTTDGADLESQNRRLVLGQRIAALTKQAIADEKDAARERERLAAEAERERKRQIAEEIREQKQLADERTRLTQELQGQLAAATSTAVDDLEIELHQLQVRIIETFGSVPAEVQPVLDDFRERIRNTKFLEGLAPEIDDLKRNAAAAGDAFKAGLSGPLLALRPQVDAVLAKLTAQLETLDKQGGAYAAILALIKEIKAEQGDALKDIGNANVTLDGTVDKTQQWADTVASVAQGILDIANGLGIVDERMSKVLQGAIGLAKNLPKALTGDPAAIFGAAAGAVSVLGGLFGGGDSPELKALKAVIETNVLALRDNTTALAGATAAQARAAIEGLGKFLGSQREGVGVDDPLFGRWNMGIAKDRAALDEELRKFGVSLKDLEKIAADNNIDISTLSRETLTQLLEAISDTDLAALEAAEAFEKAAEAMAAAAESLRDAREFADQVSDLNDVTDPAALVAAREQAQREIGALSGVFAQDLTREGGRATADAEINRLFHEAENLSVEQRGGLSVEDFREVLLEWEHLIDEMRAGEQAKQEQDAAEAERSKEQARQEAEALLDKRRLDEQAAVDERQRQDEAAAFAELQQRAGKLGGAPQEAVEAAARLLAEAIAASKGPLGEGSPLAQDARRRADQAVSEAERAVSNAERMLGADAITPGFTVQRTITESSAGRVIGELVTANAWLERIHASLGGAPAAGAGAAPPLVIQVESPVYLDGQVLTRVVSEHQFRDYQVRAALQGNNAMAS